MIAHFESPESSNAFGIQEAEEFEKLSNYALKNKVQGIIITSDTRIFCSGGNLKNYARSPKSDGLKINKKITKILNDFQHIPIPTLCILSGDCFGGGMEWLSAFDKVLATPEVMLGMWQRKISLSWGWGGANRLKYRISKKTLMRLLLEAQTISAYQALDLNLIDAIYPKELITIKAFEFFQRQAELPAYPLSPIKALNLSKLSPEKEEKVFEKLWFNPDHKKILEKKR